MVQLRVFRVRSQQATAESLGFGILGSVQVDLSQIALCRNVVGGDLQARLQLGDGVAVFLIGSKHPTQLDVGSGFIRSLADNPAEIFLGFRKTLRSEERRV